MSLKHGNLWSRIFNLLAFFLLILSLFPVTAPAESSYITIKPEILYPGDLFLIRAAYASSSIIIAELNGREFLFSSCGERCSYAIGAIDLETRPGIYKVKVFFKNGKSIMHSLRVKKREFPVVNIELPEDKVLLSPEAQARAQAEEELLQSLWQVRTERLWDGGFIKPLEGEVSTGYGVKRIINRVKVSIHKGMDLRAVEGEPVRAVNNGRVVLTKELFFGGNTIVIDHGEGLFSVYMHLSKYNVKEGDFVSKGELIGFAGSTGRASGPHLHFGFKLMDMSVNPESLFGFKELQSIYNNKN